MTDLSQAPTRQTFFTEFEPLVTEASPTLLPQRWGTEPGPGDSRENLAAVAVAPPRTLVVRETGAGPIFPAGRATLARSRPDTFVRLLSRFDRFAVRALTAVWVTCLISFWIWLLQPQHRVSTLGLVLNGTLLVYLSIIPIYFLIAANRLREVNPALPVPDLQVAFVVTKAPSEPWDVARRTLDAMLAQDFPYSYYVWLCDENPSEETLDWCIEHQVGLSTRRDAPGYHNDSWPRRTKCKEGNLAYFYDHWGYRIYDVVAQLDCDHVPAPTYLAEMVRPFADPAIGYVAAPSVCDLNAGTSWAASGRLHAEASFHGALQIGHHGIAPVCIGSHYAVRTSALEQIGGVGPELAEDFSTSFLLTSAGWQGAFAHRAEAHGDGPITLAALVKQEFQWSRSLVTVLLNTAPKHLGRMPWKLRVRFCFALAYYPLVSLMTIVGVFLPPIAAVTGVAWINVNYVDFILRWATMTCCLFAIHLLLRSRGLLRPVRPPVVSWQNWLYVLARWPYILRGTVAAFWARISPRTVGFAVTPKTRDGFEPLPVSVVTPYVAVSLLTSGSALYGEFHTMAAGYVFLCIAASASYMLVTLAVTLLHAHEAGIQVRSSFFTAVHRTAMPPLMLGIVALGPLLVAVSLYPSYVIRVFHW